MTGTLTATHAGSPTSRGESALRLLNEASAALTASLDLATTIERVARVVVPALADWCVVDLVDDATAAGGTGIRRAGAAHADPRRQLLLEELTRRFPPRRDQPTLARTVIATGRSTLANDVPDEMIDRLSIDPDQATLVRRIGLRSYMIVPLQARERLLGVVALLSGQRRYDDDDLSLAEELGRRIGMAVDNAMLFAQARASAEAEHAARMEAEQARARADDANRAKTEFLAVMSHELRTPLNAIAGYAELLEIGIHGPLNDSQREAVARIQRSERHLLALINDVLNFAKLDAGHVDIELGPVPVHETLAALEALVAPQVRAKGLDYAYAPCAADVTIEADPEKVRQILLNLLSNAIKFTDGGGRIVVTCTIEDDVVRLHVTDTGVGIPPDKLERIFEPFVQLQPGRTRTREGTGLGLAISRDLARAMHGEVAVESTVDVGSTFTLTLPRSKH
jgi:signal transduction histidine kinase